MAFKVGNGCKATPQVLTFAGHGSICTSQTVDYIIHLSNNFTSPPNDNDDADTHHPSYPGQPIIMDSLILVFVTVPIMHYILIPRIPFSMRSVLSAINLTTLKFSAI